MSSENAKNKIYMTDTHPLVWHLAEDPKLPKKARKIFEKAENGTKKILIPIVAFFEILNLIWEKRINFSHIDEILIRINAINEKFEEDQPYQFVPLDFRVLEKRIELSQISIPNNEKVKDRDLMIVAMALVNNAVLISKD